METTPYHHGSLPRALIDASLRIVEERGIEGFSLTRAAKAAGVSPAAPYRHFANKADLLRAVAAEGFHRLTAELRAAADSQHDPVEALLAAGNAYIDFAVANPGRVAVMFNSRDRAPQSSAGLEALGVLGSLLGRLEQEGSLAVPLDTALRATWALVHGLAMLHLGGMRTIAEEDSPVLRDQVLRPLVDGGLIRRA